jgi:glycosyltransferase involved in cell wall biosynthesis
MSPKRPKQRILGLATQGSGSDDEARLKALLERFSAEILPFDRSSKRRSFFSVLRQIARERPDLLVLEGTGVAGGLAALLGKLLYRTPFVVSSGDAVGPFVASRVPALSAVFETYEKLLCRHSAGFIGWTPYLTGRALTFGARRAMTAPGWAPYAVNPDEARRARSRIRSQLGIPEDAIVAGIVGSLAWNPRVRYCYGLELVQAIRATSRKDLHVLVVGSGDGQAWLEKSVESGSGRVHFPGRVPRSEVPAFLAAMDLASLPQSLDQVGSFRYTTKLSEYLSLGLPVVTGQIPLAYDLPGDWLWKIPGEAPWHPAYVEALAALLQSLTREEITRKSQQVPRSLPEFDRAKQIEKVTQFLEDLAVWKPSRS